MRPYLPLLLLASAAAPLAHADTLQFTFNGTYNPQLYSIPLGQGPDLAFSWQISGPPDFVLFDGQYPGYEFVSIPITGPDFFGTFSLGVDPQSVVFFTINDFPYDVYGLASLGTNAPFSTGPDSDPTFLPGTYNADFVFRTYTEYDGTLTVSDLSTPATATPEPSSLLLLGTGLASVTSLLRRRVMFR